MVDKLHLWRPRLPLYKARDFEIRQPSHVPKCFQTLEGGSLPHRAHSNLESESTHNTTLHMSCESDVPEHAQLAELRMLMKRQPNATLNCKTWFLYFFDSQMWKVILSHLGNRVSYLLSTTKVTQAQQQEARQEHPLPQWRAGAATLTASLATPMLFRYQAIHAIKGLVAVQL